MQPFSFMLTKEQATNLANKYKLFSTQEFNDRLIAALIEASRGDLHLKLQEAKRKKND